MITITRDWIRAVRELMERNLDTYEIAHRLNIDFDDVAMIIKIITDIAT
jgi:hypothetical protein